MRERTIYVSDGFSDLNNMIFIEIQYIHKLKLSTTLEFH